MSDKTKGAFHESDLSNRNRACPAARLRPHPGNTRLLPGVYRRVAMVCRYRPGVGLPGPVQLGNLACAHTSWAQPVHPRQYTGQRIWPAHPLARAGATSLCGGDCIFGCFAGNNRFAEATCMNTIQPLLGPTRPPFLILT